MSAMFPGDLHPTQQLHLVKSVVTVRVAQSVQAVRATPLIYHDVQAPEGVEQPVRAPDVQIDCFRCDHSALIGGRKCQAIELPVLVADNQAPLGVDAHRHPRTLYVSGNGVQQFQFEVLRDRQLAIDIARR